MAFKSVEYKNEGRRIMDRFIHELANKIKVADKKLIIGISGHGAAGKLRLQTGSSTFWIKVKSIT